MDGRMDIAKRFLVNDLVETPLGRRARVLGYDDEGRVELRYVDKVDNAIGKTSASMLVILAHHLLKRCSH
jgi:hypothetical protein